MGVNGRSGAGAFGSGAFSGAGSGSRALAPKSKDVSALIFGLVDGLAQEGPVQFELAAVNVAGAGPAVKAFHDPAVYKRSVLPSQAAFFATQTKTAFQKFNSFKLPS